ncbi:MAG TPA: flagellar export chaperone FliS [Steroidobacteraceae bacterium]|nr:flagellar export chaperone FliS [Steroidobacteraceae bacterium]
MNPYARTSKLAAYQSVAAHGGVSGADPHHLVVMLMDAALERMSSARGCIERGEHARKAKLLHNCVKLIAELRGSLNLAEGGTLAQNLSDLYEYMMKRLLVANASSDVSCLAEVSSLLGEIRAAWAAIGPEVRKAAPAAAAAPEAVSSHG